MIHVLEDGLILEMRGDGGVVLLNSLDVLRSWRSLIFLIVVISLTREIFRTFMLVWRAKLRRNYQLEIFEMNRRKFYPHIGSDQEHHACRMMNTHTAFCCGQK